MKRFLLLILSITILAGCGGDSNDEVTATPQCYTVTGINAVQRADEIDFSITGDGGLYYEISVAIAGSGNTNPDYNSIVPLASATETVSIPRSLYARGAVLFYARAVCDNDQKGAWFGPKLFTIADYCGKPAELNVTAYSGASWRYSLSEVGVSNYQVEYGLQGFTLGTGTTVTVNQENFNNFTTLAGNSYDFYVRAYCVNNVGYGNWTGPFTFFSENNINACLPPLGVTYTSTYVSTTSRNTQFRWNANGEDSFEYTIVHRNENVNTGNISSTGNPQAGYYLDPYFDFDFYVRSVCNNGNRTAWVKIPVNL